LLYRRTRRVAGQRQPTDVELRSVYCISVLQENIGYRQLLLAKVEREVPIPSLQFDELRAKDPGLARVTEQDRRSMKGSLAELQSALNRLQSYILPRLTSDVAERGLVLARQRGTADWNTFDTMGVESAGRSAEARHRVQETRLAAVLTRSIAPGTRRRTGWPTDATPRQWRR
jgi:hypothetical protein